MKLLSKLAIIFSITLSTNSFALDKSNICEFLSDSQNVVDLFSRIKATRDEIFEEIKEIKEIREDLNFRRDEIVSYYTSLLSDPVNDTEKFKIIKKMRKDLVDFYNDSNNVELRSEIQGERESIKKHREEMLELRDQRKLVFQNLSTCGAKSSLKMGPMIIIQNEDGSINL